MEEGMKACPACAEPIRISANRCRFCNTDLEAYTTARPTSVEQTLFSGHPAVMYTAGQYVWAVITLGVMLIVYWIRSKSTEFTITTQRVRVKQGLLWQTQDNLELFRVDHFDLLKPLGQRLLGQCSLLLHSSDTRMPRVRIYGIPGLEKLADDLREFSLRERTRRRVLPVESM